MAVNARVRVLLAAGHRLTTAKSRRFRTRCPNAPRDFVAVYFFLLHGFLTRSGLVAGAVIPVASSFTAILVILVGAGVLNHRYRKP